MNREHAKGKRGALTTNRAALTEHNKVIPAPIMRFSADVIRQLTPGVLHRFSPDQRRALDALCYTMEATDELLAETLRLSEKFRGELKDAERSATADQLLSYYNDGIVNLGRLIEMCDLYLAKEYRIIVTKQYHRGDYAM